MNQFHIALECRRAAWMALNSVLCLIVAAILLPDRIAFCAEAGADSAKAWRQSAVNRRRRIIYNNDGNEPVTLLKRPSAQEMLDFRTTSLADSQVDTIFYCTWSSGFSLFSHFTKVGQPFISRQEPWPDNQMSALIEAGLDPLQVITDFCKRQKIEIFWSMRMNDNHDASKAVYGAPLFQANKLKNEHPEYLLGAVDRRPKHGAWTAVNYGLPGIRELAFQYVREVCENYDVDGVELDFFRHPVFFMSNAEGKPASDEERAAMTKLLKRIRDMADDVGKKRGRPILLAVRTPDSVEYARAIGLDIETWFANDLCDLFIPAGTFQLNPWSYSVQLGHKYGLKVYPSLDESRVRDPQAKDLRFSDLAYRGRASDVWQSGADGVYLFNFFIPHKSDSPLLKELGDRDKLASLDQDFFACARTPLNASGGNLPFDPFLNIETLDSDHAKTIAPGDSVEAQLHVPLEFTLQPNTRLLLTLKFKAPFDATPTISLNGAPLVDPEIEDARCTFLLAPTLLQPGINRVGVNVSRNAAPIVWSDLFLQVRHNHN